jgi:DeoR/GlpR family transcriptional regulator of sugar metabolism
MTAADTVNRRQRVLEYVRTHPYTTAGAVTRALQGNPGTITKDLDALAAQGLVTYKQGWRTV